MLAEAYVCHQTANRLRIKIPSKKGDAAFFHSVRDAVSGFPGVREVHVNPLTGSVLLIHNLDPATISRLQSANGFLRFPSAGRNKATLHDRVVHSFGFFNEQVKASTGGELDLASLAFFGLLGMGLYQISLGEFILPAWYTAFWYASSIVSRVQSGRDNEHTEEL